MNFKTFLPDILKSNRAAMRDCALSYRRAQQAGDICRMVRWLILAGTFRDLNQGYLEAA